MVRLSVRVTVRAALAVRLSLRVRPRAALAVRLSVGVIVRAAHNRFCRHLYAA